MARATYTSYTRRAMSLHSLQVREMYRSKSSACAHLYQCKLRDAKLVLGAYLLLIHPLFDVFVVRAVVDHI